MEDAMAPQTFLYGCTLENKSEVVFNPGDEFEHQLDLRMVCVDQTTKDEINTVEVEVQDAEGRTVKAVLASLKPSTLPSVCLGGFSITPPAVFRLKSGSGPIHISGQCLVMMDSESDEDDDDDDEEEEEEEEEEEVPVKATNKRPASSPSSKSRKKSKMEVEEDEDDDDDSGDDEEESMEDESPVKAKPAPAKAKSQNGKAVKQPPAKKEKPAKGKDGKTPKTPPTPKTPLTVPEIKVKITEAMKKGVSLPKLQSKFENFVKHSYKLEDAKGLAELWKWKQTVTDSK